MGVGRMGDGVGEGLGSQPHLCLQSTGRVCWVRSLSVLPGSPSHIPPHSAAPAHRAVSPSHRPGCFLYTVCDPAVILGPQGSCHAGSQVWHFSMAVYSLKIRPPFGVGKEVYPGLVTDGCQGIVPRLAQMGVRSATR